MHEIIDLPEDCPWADWKRPNLRWCEEPKCGYIVTPWNTFSNLAYITVFFIMVDQIQRKYGGSALLWLFAFGAITTGITSGLYHASYTFFFQWWDFFGMFTFLCSPVVANMQRLGMIGAGSEILMYIALLTVLSVLVVVMFVVGLPFQILVLVCIVFTLITELRLAKKGGIPASDWSRLGHVYKALIFLVIAGTLSGLDQAGIFCNPKSHFQGHALWHYFSAVAMLQLFYHYAENVLSKRPITRSHA